MSTSYGRDDEHDQLDVDLSQVRADDALLDALGGADPKLADELGEAELNALLLSWSREVDGEPMPELVSVDTAVTTIQAATANQKTERRERRRRLLVPVAAAASVLVIAFGGASVAAREAMPGDTLWGLTQVLYADKADSVEASFEVKAEFKRARDAISDGELDTARDALNKARVSLESVRDEENHDGLSREHRELMTQLRENDGTPADDDDEPTTTTESPSSSSSTSPSPSSTSEPPLIKPPPEGSESTSPSSSPSEEPATSESPSSTTTSGTSTSDNTSAQSDDGSTSDSGSEVESQSEPVG
ncbi:anti-sigma-D factor RsdA [Haloechinothrix salitolerans]|uniref:Anti-sigma-D factor RsdA n=1 Tax=Haloechinothrix salitolerans TaxID=926830 RepID=A0ABW2C8B9_9PSEU